ncbi:Lipid-A-disaccharide synthase [Acaryochloris thomasi RCC1774]|uniref:Lipid-A-disaccharide synthase n=1 Tax=Acaryochloris thomasi RCC1774 TaxID=1764569 RepID=A0A2W1JF74_9CYAN|nr:lipid-A-disaccharide synthase [Acaryochloris thomasi]PZD72268.1 Lipid-A-disaccharide synthase [Acaryochloris thomasi RCC1774]
MSAEVAPIDIVILTNGPGELMTWVRPVVKALRDRLGSDSAQVRLSIVLAPCVHASGGEVAIASTFPEIDRVQGPEHFWPFLLRGKTAESWDWRSNGVVLFLGGDQFFSVMIGKRLGYRIVTYAEWSARWLPWIDRCGVVSEQIKIPAQHQHKCRVVGDLIAEAQSIDTDQEKIHHALGFPSESLLIGLLPGSKPAKLTLGVPFCVAIAEALQHQLPQTQFVIPVAPTLDLQDLAQYADPQRNAVLTDVEGKAAQLIESETSLPYLLSSGGTRIALWTASPAYDLLSLCQLCVTTVGANTAELASLAVPMVVLLPTQKLEVMRAWDGVPGLLANLPGVGTAFAKLINGWILKRGLGLRAWPNIWADREIVPELVGHLHPSEVAQQIADLLLSPTALPQMRHDLQQVRGQTGAASKVATLVQEALALDTKPRNGTALGQRQS